MPLDRTCRRSDVVLVLSGLLGDSVIMADNLGTIGTAAIHLVIGSIPMTEIDIALRHTLQL